MESPTRKSIMNRDFSARKVNRGAKPALRSMASKDRIQKSPPQPIYFFSPTQYHTISYKSPTLLARTKPSNLDVSPASSDRSIGRMFQANCTIGGTPDKIENPFAKDKAIRSVNFCCPIASSSELGSDGDGDGSGCEELEREWRKKSGREWEIEEWVEVLFEAVPFVG